MADTTFTFRVDEELKAAFADAARAQDRTSAQLLRTLMRETADATRQQREYNDWFDEQVEIGLKEADDPNTAWVPHEVVKQDMAKQRAKLLARLKDAAE